MTNVIFILNAHSNNVSTINLIQSAPKLSIFDVLLKVIPLISLSLAILGIFIWKRQLIWTQKFKYVESILKDLFELKEAIHVFRWPYLLYYNYCTDPSPEAHEFVKQNPKLLEFINSKYRYSTNFQKILDCYHSLTSKIRNYNVLYKNLLEKEMQDLRISINKIDTAYTEKLNKIRNPEYDYNEKLYNPIIHVVNEIEKDEFLKSLETLYNSIEEKLKKTINFRQRDEKKKA